MPRDFSEASDTITAPRAGAMSNATRASGTAPKGRLCKVEDATGTKEYEYDLLGRVTDVTETRGALTFTLGYSYDLAGNVTGITLPSGRAVSYTLNGNGQVSGVSADVDSTPTTLASSITYLPFGPMNALTYGNSLTFSATFDQDYYPTNRTVSGSIYNNTYDTDANGNIIQIGSTDYDYDALDRLDEEDSGSAVTYTYDATSNRLTQTGGPSVTVPAGSNKISAVGGDSYTYDAAGNITDDDTYEYTWDAANRLEEIELSGTSTNVGSYGYNHASQRTTKTVASVTTHYVYGIDGQLYGEYDSSGDFIREYVYLNGQPLAQIDAGSPEVLTYLHVDHLGTPRYGTNTGGTQVWAWAGDAFGVGAPTGSVTVNLRMPGQYFDAESGIFYNWNRYYNPAIGRYISSDPIGLDGGINTFLYANANPVMFFDPAGLDAWVRFLGGVRATGGALEAAAGAVLGVATSWTGVGAVAGGAIGLHGLDQVQAGLRELFGGCRVDSLTSQGLQGIGLSRDTANFLDATGSVVGSFGSGLSTQAIRAGGFRNVLYYEAGQSTVSQRELARYARFQDPVERGIARVAEQGWFRALFSGFGAPAQFGNTIGSGLTPAGWGFLGAVGAGAASGLSEGNCGCD